MAMKHTSVDGYIGSFPPAIQRLLRETREAIRQVAPDAEEKISYQIPAFAYNGKMVHYAAFKHHIGFYPGERAIKHFSGFLEPYKTRVGSVQFPFDHPLPLELVKEIVQFRFEAM